MESSHNDVDNCAGSDAPRFGTIPPGSRRSDGVSKELYLQFIGGTPVARYSEAGKRTSERISLSIYLSLCGMTHLRISYPHEEVVLLDQTVGSDVDSWLDKPED